MTLARQTIVEINGLTLEHGASIEAVHFTGGLDSNGLAIAGSAVRLTMRHGSARVTMQFPLASFRDALADLLRVADAQPLEGPIE